MTKFGDRRDGFQFSTREYCGSIDLAAIARLGEAVRYVYKYEIEDAPFSTRHQTTSCLTPRLSAKACKF